MNDIQSKLALLNAQELAKVYKLIDKLASKHKVEETPPAPPVQPVKTEAVRPARSQESKQDSSWRDSVRPAGGKRRNVDDGGETVTIRGLRGGQFRQGKGTRLARQEPMDNRPKPNKFFELIESTPAIQNDPEVLQAKELDNKIKNIQKTPMPRNTRPDPRVWIECTGRCGNEYLVNPELITSVQSFMCNECIVGNSR